MRQTKRGVSLGLFLGFFCLYAFTSPPKLPQGDGWEMMQVAAKILNHGFSEEPTLPNNEAFSRFGLGQSLLELPFVKPYLSAQAALNDNAIMTYILNTLVVYFLPAAIGGACVVLLFHLGMRLGYSRGASFFMAALGGCATMIWPYANTMFADLTVALCLLAGLYALVVFRGNNGPGPAALAGAALGFGFLAKPTVLLVAPFYGIYLLKTLYDGSEGFRSYRPVAAFTGMFLFFLAVSLWYNNLRYGNIFTFGYVSGREASIGFGTPLLVGLFGNLLSPGKSFFLYNPILLLSLVGFTRFFKKDRDEGYLILSVALVWLFLHSIWWAWSGDWAWGPRFMVSLTPLLLLFTLPVLEVTLRRPKQTAHLQEGKRWLTALLVFVSIMVQLPGVLIHPNEYIMVATTRTGVFQPEFYDPEKTPVRDNLVNLHFIPEFSPLAGHVWMARAAYFEGERKKEVVLNPPWKPLNPAWSTERLLTYEYRFNIWWLFALKEKVPYHGWLVLAGFALLTLSGLFLRMAWKVLLDLNPAPETGEKP